MSTRIWEFTMNCHLCGNKIVVQTDPENTDYKYIEGAYKIVNQYIFFRKTYLKISMQFKTEDASDADFLRDEKEIEKIRGDKFYQLEHKQKDIIKGNEEKERISHIIEKQV